MPDIFSPTMLGAIRLSNHIVMAPMTRDRAGPQDEPTDIMVEYYRQRASAGLIVTEGVQPSPAGKGYWRTPGIHSDVQTAGWKKVNDAVTARGGAIVMQLMHVGRASVRANKDPKADTYAPSAIASRHTIPGPDGVPVATETPRALELSEIPGVIGEYVQAAKNARAAGLEGVELHCASGYLPMQFLSSNSNQRTDAYGGSATNRIRFAVETLEAMSAAIGADRVGFRICPGIGFNDMKDANPAETYEALARAVNGLGLAYMHIIHVPQFTGLDSIELLRPIWSGNIIGNSGLTLESGQAWLDTGKVQAVSYGQAFVGNPDLVERFKVGAPIVELNRDTLYTGGGDDRVGYTDYPLYTGAPA
jgi:N-ethylmaleimide reductase